MPQQLPISCSGCLVLFGSQNDKICPLYELCVLYGTGPPAELPQAVTSALLTLLGSQDDVLYGTAGRLAGGFVLLVVI